MLGRLVRELWAYGQCMKARILHVFPYAWFALGGILIASRCRPPLLQTFEAVVAMYAIGTSAYAFNDAMDLELDKVNQVVNPLTGGKVSEKEALRLAAVSAVVGMLLSYAISLEAFALGLVYLTLGFMYSTPQIYLKRRLLGKTFVAAIGIAISYLFGGASIGVISTSLLYIAGLMFAVAVAFNPLMDLPDLEGDMKRGCKTLAIMLGAKLSVEFATVILISTAVFTTIYSYLFGLGLMLPLLVGRFCLSSIWTAYPLLKLDQDPKYGKRMLRIIFPIQMLFQAGLILTTL